MSYLKSVDPYTNKEISKIKELDKTQIKFKIEKAGDAFLKFRNTDFAYKRLLMHRAAKILRERKDEYASLITSEMGKLISESKSEVEKCAWVCEYYADHAETILKSAARPSDAVESYILYQPIGPVLAVMPWNFPFWQVFRFAAPALMAGNTALLKHASNVQGCAAAIESIFLDAGFPESVFTNFPISSSKVKYIIESDLVRAITLTGSEFAGSAVASIAGKCIKKTVLELGGNNAFVVLKDADIEHAVNVAVTARMINCGQSCIAAKRFIIESEVYDDFLSGLKSKISDLKPGDPTIEKTGYGPLFAAHQAEEIEFQVKDAVEGGAKIEIGGARKEAFFEPTVISGVNPSMKVFSEETFGPVFAVVEADNMFHAMELSNDSEFGLGMQVFTSSDDAASYFIENANEGAVFVNGMVKSDPRLPFGGVKKSGFGRELSAEGIKEFVNIKTVWKNL